MEENYGMVMVPAVVRGRNTDVYGLAIVTLDLKSAGEHWGTIFLTPMGVLDQQSEKLTAEQMNLLKKYYVSYDYWYTPLIERDIHVDFTTMPEQAANIIVFCGHCGDIYRRIKWNNRGCKSTVWRCVSRVLKKSSGIDCPARTIHEEVLQAAVVTAVNDAWSRKDAILPELRENIRLVLEEDTDA